MTGPGSVRPVCGQPLDWLVACDLDQTLIYSRRSFQLGPDAREPDLALVESIDAAPAAYMTARAFGLLGGLARAAGVAVVPVTTRTNAQYARVRLGFVPPYAVTANGGHLLVDGVEDRDWAAGLAERLAAACRPLSEVVEVAEKLASAGWARLVRVADDLFVYLVAHDRDAIGDLTGATADLAEGGWTVSVQGRKVYLVPSVLSKEAALAEVVRRTGAARLAAAGDSLLDRGMLARADLAYRPAHGELHDLGWSAPRLRVTAARGLLAGEELLAGLATAVGPAAAVGPGAGAAAQVPGSESTLT